MAEEKAGLIFCGDCRYLNRNHLGSGKPKSADDGWYCDHEENKAESTNWLMVEAIRQFPPSELNKLNDCVWFVKLAGRPRLVP